MFHKNKKKFLRSKKHKYLNLETKKFMKGYKNKNNVTY